MRNLIIKRIEKIIHNNTFKLEFERPLKDMDDESLLTVFSTVTTQELLDKLAKDRINK
jgi:hypothetical protein